MGRLSALLEKVEGCCRLKAIGCRHSMHDTALLPLVGLAGQPFKRQQMYVCTAIWATNDRCRAQPSGGVEG